MTTWLISDTHHFHANILKHTNRPFQTVESMDAYIFNAWRQHIRERDVVVHLGDVGMAPTRAETEERLREIIPELPGCHKILLRGNHDLSVKKMLSVGFHEVHDFLYLNHNGLNIGMAHKPNHVDLMRHVRKGNIGLHGHIHNHSSPLDNLINLSVEKTGYEPVTIDDILEPVCL